MERFLCIYLFILQYLSDSLQSLEILGRWLAVFEVCCSTFWHVGAYIIASIKGSLFFPHM